MPIPKCKSTEVYHKKTKSCIEIGSNKYKNIIKENPNAFTQFDKKIQKVLKYKNPVCKENQVFSKLSKRCITIDGPGFKAALKKNPAIFNNQLTKIAKWQLLKKMDKLGATIPNSTKNIKLCGEGKVYNPKTKRCIKIESQTFKQALKKDPKIFDSQREKIKIWETNKKLLKPVVAKNDKTSKYLPPVKVSKLAKQLFINKARKILRNAESKSLDAVKHLNTSKIPPYVLVKKNIHVLLNYFNYFPNGRVSLDSFAHNIKRTRDLITLKFYRDNISSHFYKHMLKSNLNPEIIDTKWFVEMQKYIYTLTPRERYALFSYTHNGDVYVNFLERGLKLDFDRINIKTVFYEFMVYMANPKNPRSNIFKSEYNTPIVERFLNMTPKEYKKVINEKRGKKIAELYDTFFVMPTKFFKKDFVILLIKNLSNTISSIIKKSPPTRKPMVVFRGVRDSFFTSNNYKSGKKSTEIFYNKGFVSTSLQHNIAIETFTNTGAGCCFKVITILPGTRCIPLIGLTYYSNEAEILLDKNIKYIIRDKYEAKIPIEEKTVVTNSGNPIKMKIAEIIIG